MILEKPFCTTADHARELVALAPEKGSFLIDAVPTAFLPNLEVLKEALPKLKSQAGPGQLQPVFQPV